MEFAASVFTTNDSIDIDCSDDDDDEDDSMYTGSDAGNMDSDGEMDYPDILVGDGITYGRAVNASFGTQEKRRLIADSRRLGANRTLTYSTASDFDCGACGRYTVFLEKNVNTDVVQVSFEYVFPVHHCEHKPLSKMDMKHVTHWRPVCALKFVEKV
jgi:hypothetical protein